MAVLIVGEPQYMTALAKANRVRLARAALKHQVAEGRSPASVLRALGTGEAVEYMPGSYDAAQRRAVAGEPMRLGLDEVVKTMEIADLLGAQDRWGRSRVRRFLASLPMTETKTVGMMTKRQRDEIAQRLAPLRAADAEREASHDDAV
jgi:hypothetical protein